MKKSTHKIFLFVIRFLLRLIARVEVIGFESLPRAGGYVIASNHIGRLDAAMAYFIINRPDIIMIV